MAYPHTPSRARGEVADSDIEPSDIAPSAAPSPLSTSVRPNVETVEGPESVSAESAGPVSAPTLSLSAGSHPSLGSHGILGSAGPSQVGVSALRYPSGQADPPDSMHMHIGGQISTSLATGIVAAEVHAQLEQSSTSSSLRQPPTATAAAETAAAEGLTLVSAVMSMYLGAKIVVRTVYGNRKVLR